MAYSDWKNEKDENDPPCPSIKVPIDSCGRAIAKKKAPAKETSVQQAKDMQAIWI